MCRTVLTSLDRLRRAPAVLPGDELDDAPHVTAPELVRGPDRLREVRIEGSYRACGPPSAQRRRQPPGWYCTRPRGESRRPRSSAAATASRAPLTRYLKRRQGHARKDAR
jgi:hypothetical protein